MQKRTLPLSLLIGAALTIPSLAMAAPADTTPVDMQTATADNTLQNEAESADGELVSNQSSPFEISETKTFSRANVNNNANREEMATEIQTQQEAMQDPQEAMLQEEAMQDPQEAILQEEAMQDPQTATQPLIR